MVFSISCLNYFEICGHCKVDYKDCKINQIMSCIAQILHVIYTLLNKWKQIVSFYGREYFTFHLKYYFYHADHWYMFKWFYLM